jgi:diacylglycerol kinase (ATP)
LATLLCVNAHSRNGDYDLDAIRSKLEALGPVVPCDTDRDSIGKALSDSDLRFERIVVGGGDGTINRVLPALVDAGLPCGIIPLGTANDFVRSLGLSLEPDDAAEPILQGATRRIGLGEVNGRLFVNAVGIGLGPELTRNLDKESKRRLGVLAYLASLIRVVRDTPYRRAAVTVDGHRRHIAFMQITIANGIHYGGGMTVSEDADLSDGWLRVLCLEPQSVTELLGKFVPLRWGKRANSETEKLSLYRGHRVSVKTWRKVDVTADGELVTSTPVVCRSHPGVLDVYAPTAKTDMAATQ